MHSESLVNGNFMFSVSTARAQFTRYIFRWHTFCTTHPFLGRLSLVLSVCGVHSENLLHLDTHSMNYYWFLYTICCPVIAVTGLFDYHFEYMQSRVFGALNKRLRFFFVRCARDAIFGFVNRRAVKICLRLKFITLISDCSANILVYGQWGAKQKKTVEQKTDNTKSYEIFEFTLLFFSVACSIVPNGNNFLSICHSVCVDKLLPIVLNLC